jgi:Tfp pilus assembly protein PilO
MAKLSEKQILLAVGGAALVLCGIGGAGVWWSMGLVEEQETAIARKQSQIEAARRKIRKIPKIEKAVIILRENVHQYVKILPQERELNKFFRTAQRFAIQSGINIEKALPGRQARGRRAFESVVYRFEFQANLWQFMKFINFFENYDRFVKVRDVRMSKTRTRGQARQAGEMTHSFIVTVETYVYNVQGKGKLTAIPNYPNKRDSLRHEIASSLQDISSERYEFKGQQGRRDIFVDPREFHSAGTDGSDSPRMPPQKQKEYIENTAAQIGTYQRYWKESLDPSLTIFKKYELQKRVSKGLVELAGIVDQVTEHNLISNQALKVRWYKEVLMPLKRLRKQVMTGEIDADKYLSIEDFKQLNEDLRTDLLEGSLQQAVNRFQNVQPKLEVPAGDPRYQERIRAEGYVLRARVAMDFSAMTLEISGVVVNEDGKSGVILNKQVFQEGDWVTDQLFIKGVRREEVEFVYKGFTLVKTW